MNLLKSGSLGRCCSGSYWCTPSCRDTVKTSSLLLAQCNPNTHKLQSNTTKMCDSHRTKLCSGRKPQLALWTQIRFNKGFPRFHRDIEFPNFDGYRKDQFVDVRKTKWGQGDEKCGHTYALAFLGSCAVMYGAKTVLTDLIMSMSAAADVLAMASIEVDLTKVAPGACIAVKWRGKPLFIKNRTQADIDLEATTPLSALKDPQSVEDRCMKPEWLIVIGICTHLGCVPIPNAGEWSGGFYCPCHGSHYDNVGRARRGPAPTNLEVPPYKFMSDSLILVG